MALTWEDKEVRFDIPFSEMRLKSEEKIVDRLDNIEDTKGNGGDRGRMIITTLRILWHSISSPRINLSIGFNSIISISTKVVNSKLRGTTQALHMLTNSNNTRFEFIFTNLIPGNMRHFTSVMGVHKAYLSSKLYRELKLRGAVVYNKQLKILPLEQVFTTLHGVWNLSSDQGNLGTLIISNVRLVWFADMNEGFNISLPHLQIDTIKVRDSKFGTALVITSTQESGGYILGFRIDPEEKLHVVYKELISLYLVYNKKPIYGVEYKWSHQKETDLQKQHLIDDFSEVEEPKGEMTNVITAYLADGGHIKDRMPLYSEDLGIAIESIKEGYTLQKLWEVIPM
ncbi:PREDICTED: Bardet-Biedl syndrome 5 protein homolog [Nicrophorus vespilloides]|uniref:Bardet-Biedl syndrome 5 protein homolog n=1 Tax=Nicrophorus vespilloides TaxID=110193 RepID=A0ABM1N619_NICVS|nr:PREDICTED: Bardet-Biedl syndrome 5 protein homolog [Nicrophorus vespilloides]